MGALRIAALGILLTANTAAMADPVTLICNMVDTGRGTYQEDEPTTVELNEQQNSVTVHFGREHLAVGASNHVLTAWTQGPVIATFTDNAISFSLVQFGKPASSLINRLTGTFVITQDQHDVGSWTCHAAQKQF